MVCLSPWKMIPSLTQLKTCSSIRRCRRRCRRTLLRCFYAGRTDGRSAGCLYVTAEELSTVPTLSFPPSLACSMQEVKVRIPGPPSASVPRCGAERPIDARIAVRKDGGSARRVAQHVALFLHFAHMQGGQPA